MKRRRLLAVSIVVALAAVGCKPEPAALTQVMVVVDGDLSGIDAVRVRVEGMGRPRIATAYDLDVRPLPRTVAVVHDGGPMGPIVITAEGLAESEVLVAQTAELSFVEGRNLMLRLQLASSCVGMRCTRAAHTCREGACVAHRVEGSELDDWPGSVPNQPERDAGADSDASTWAGGSGGSGGAGGATGSGGQSGGGSGGAAVEDAGPVDAGCNDCTFDPGIDDPHGGLSCEASCELRCDSGYRDRDGERGNGCEAVDANFPWNPSNIDPESPSWVPSIAAALQVDCTAEMDFGSVAAPAAVEICGQSVTPMVWAQSGGREAVVLAMRGLHVQPGAKLRFVGARPVILAVYGDATVEGEIDVSAIGAAPAAGSNAACEPGSGGAGEDNTGEGGGGGGGGGFAQAGADGGPATSGGKGGTGGPAGGDPQLRPLRGGCPGGSGGKDEGSRAAGGAGGGALQMSVTGTLRLAGLVAAGGGAGAGGLDDGDGGGGGGSGGAILLEATRIQTLSGSWLTANGGSGGGGAGVLTDATPGADGVRDGSQPAVGGTGVGKGGDGAALGGSPSNGEPPANSSACNSVSCGGGGGGGGVGRIVLRSNECQLAGGTSPAATCIAR